MDKRAYVVWHRPGTEAGKPLAAWRIVGSSPTRLGAEAIERAYRQCGSKVILREGERPVGAQPRQLGT